MKVSGLEINEIKITNFLKTSIEELTKMEAISSNPTLFWCNGFLFSATIDQVDSIIEKQLEGIMVLDTFYYALTEKLSQAKWNGYSIEVLDFTGHSIFEKLTEQIKENKIE